MAFFLQIVQFCFVNRGTRNAILGDRIRPNFDTSFTGKDLLRTRLQDTSSLPGTKDGNTANLLIKSEFHHLASIFISLER